MCVWSNTSVKSTHKPGLDHFPPSCCHPPFALGNASLGHYIGPLEEGEEMQRSSQTDTPLCCIFCEIKTTIWNCVSKLRHNGEVMILQQ